MHVIAALIGAFLRLLYGGAPHVQDPAGAVGVQLRGWLGKGWCYALFFLLGWITLLVDNNFEHVAACAVISIWLAAGWNPGHGSYLNPGNMSPDNEDLTRWWTRMLSFGAPAGSVHYACTGMAVRYGFQTLLVASVMLICNTFLETHFNLWYGLVGFGAGPIMYALHLAKWQKWKLGSWVDPVFHNGPFELAVGALLYGTL